MAGKVVLGEHGKKVVQWNSSKLYQYFLQEKCRLGDDISAQFTNKRPKRSVNQNNYLHLYLSLIKESCGQPMNALKAWVKGRFLSQGISEVFGDKVRIVKSTSELSISEFAELLNRIEEVTEIPLPDPEPFNLPMTLDEYGKLKYEQKQTYRKMVAKNISQ